MGPSNPWSPDWRPDPTGARLVSIRAARRGAVLAGVVYVPVAAAALAVGPWPRDLALLALVVGLPGVALLGAGLGSSTLGSLGGACLAGVAFAVGAPVAAVTSGVIAALVLDLLVQAGRDLVGPVLRAGVLAAFSVAPLVAAAAATWVVVTRWSGRRPLRSERTDTDP